MKAERLKYWMNRSDVVKVDGHRAVNFHSSASQVIITIFWSHQGVFPTYSDREERFSILVTSGDGYATRKEDLETKSALLDLSQYSYLLVNKHEPDYAILYCVALDPSQRIFTFKIKEYPELGKLIISESEEAGLKVGF
jgi:hypothetical protein